MAGSVRSRGPPPHRRSAATGAGLRELTEFNAKPTVRFAGKYRIIDCTLSNCINSGLRRVYVLTQYQSHALLKHIARGWAMSHLEFDEFVEVLPVHERHAGSSWYRGTADAVYQNLAVIQHRAPRHVIVLARDACDEGSGHDFGGDIIPTLIRDQRVFACRFEDMSTGGMACWRDVGTIDAYWRCNLEIADVAPQLDLYDEDWPTHTAPRELPPAKFVFDDEGRRGTAVDSLVSAGCIVSGADVRRSVLWDNVRIESADATCQGRGCRVRARPIATTARAVEGGIRGDGAPRPAARAGVC